MTNNDSRTTSLSVRVNESYQKKTSVASGVQVVINPTRCRLEGNGVVLLSPDADTIRQVTRDNRTVTHTYRLVSGASTHDRYLHIYATVIDENGGRHRIHQDCKFRL